MNGNADEHQSRNGNADESRTGNGNEVESRTGNGNEDESRNRIGKEPENLNRGGNEPSSSRPPDRGAQLERTALAWRRTCLAMAVGSLVAARILPELFGDWAVIVGGLGVIAALVLMAVAHFRYRSQLAAMTSAQTEKVSLGGSGSIAVLTVLTIAAGVISLVAVMALVGQRLTF